MRSIDLDPGRFAGSFLDQLFDYFQSIAVEYVKNTCAGI